MNNGLHYTALFVVNLEPKKMMGEVSEGMLFDIGYPDNIMPVLAVPEKPVPNGAGWGKKHLEINCKTLQR
jgi:tRNA-binding EMAP/Myf-like protein